MIKVEALCHAYNGGNLALKDVSFEIRSGERVVVLGANGSGKSTLLGILDGLVTPQNGRWFWQGREMSPRVLKNSQVMRDFRRRVVFLFQNPDAMVFNPSVYDEIAYGVRQLGLDDTDRRVRHWANELGVGTLLGRTPFELSGGEKQRVCLAALLALEPELLLLDEPTGRLDPRSTGWLVDFLAELNMTTLVTTHSLSLAPELGDRALVLSDEHELIYDGDIESFMADMSLLIRANLVHRHRHGGRLAGKYHTHDWS